MDLGSKTRRAANRRDTSRHRQPPPSDTVRATYTPGARPPRAPKPPSSGRSSRTRNLQAVCASSPAWFPRATGLRNRELRELKSVILEATTSEATASDHERPRMLAVFVVSTVDGA